MIDYKDVRHPRNARRHTPPAVPEGDDRTPAQRDRDRILYTSAFRRLAEVTQVASPHHGHVFHNRLTHSLQVAQVGRRLAEKLYQKSAVTAEEVGGLDSDVVEAACLAHDLGHPPFGHIAEELLDSLARRAGGFEGNAQSFRIVTTLAFRSPDYRGLDLTRATLGALLKYPWSRNENEVVRKKWGAYKSEREDFRFARTTSSSLKKFQRTIEADLMDWADDVTYSAHDVEDFYRAGFIPMHLLAPVAWDNRERQRFFDDVYRRHGKDKTFYNRSELEEAFLDVLAMHWRIDNAYNGSKDQRARLRDFVGKLIGRYINGVELDSKSKSAFVDPQHQMEVTILKELTWTYVIEAPALATEQEGQRRIVKLLFEVYSDAASTKKKLGIFPTYYRERLLESESSTAKTRIVIDLIAGMSEPEAINTYRMVTAVSSNRSLQDTFR